MYQLELLHVYRMVNVEAAAYIKQYEFYRSVLGDLRKYVEGFKDDPEMEDIRNALTILAQKGKLETIKN